MPGFEQRIDNLCEDRTFVFACGANAGKLPEIDAVFRTCGLRVIWHRPEATRNTNPCSWNAFGSLQAQDRLVSVLTVDESIHELRF